jgi:hypothetical protein
VNGLNMRIFCLHMSHWANLDHVPAREGPSLRTASLCLSIVLWIFPLGPNMSLLLWRLKESCALPVRTPPYERPRPPSSAAGPPRRSCLAGKNPLGIIGTSKGRRARRKRILVFSCPLSCHVDVCRHRKLFAFIEWC